MIGKIWKVDWKVVDLVISVCADVELRFVKSPHVVEGDVQNCLKQQGMVKGGGSVDLCHMLVGSNCMCEEVVLADDVLNADLLSFLYSVLWQQL